MIFELVTAIFFNDSKISRNEATWTRNWHLRELWKEVIRWLLLEEGELKINIDGAYVSGSNGGSIACICHNSSTTLVDGFARTVLVSSIEQAKTLAMVETLKFSLSMDARTASLGVKLPKFK